MIAVLAAVVGAHLAVAIPYLAVACVNAYLSRHGSSGH